MDKLTSKWRVANILAGAVREKLAFPSGVEKARSTTMAILYIRCQVRLLYHRDWLGVPIILEIEPWLRQKTVRPAPTSSNKIRSCIHRPCSFKYFSASTWMQVCEPIVLRRSRGEKENPWIKNTADGPYYGNLCALMVSCVIRQDKFPRGLNGGASTIFHPY